MLNLSVFQTILLAVFGAFAIGGVLIFALVVGGGGGNSVGPVVIWGTEDANAFTVLIRQVAENDGRLSQVTYIEKDPITYEAELTEALANGLGPDIFLLRQDQVVRNAGKVFPIPYDFLSKSQFETIFVEAAKPYLGENGVLGIPIIVDPLVMYWNRDLIESAGFATPPKYWDEISGVAEAIVKKDDSGSILKTALSFGEYQNVDHAKDVLSLLILQAGGSITERDSTGRLIPALSARTSGRELATESALRFYTGFADPSKADYSWNRSLPSSRAAFTAGDLALYFGFASEDSEIARANPNLNFAAAPVPQIRTAESKMDVARVHALAISRASRNPQGAMTVASLIAEADVARGLSVALGIPSARRDILSETSSDENTLYESQAVIARSWIDPDPEKTSGIFRVMIEGVTSGSARLAEAIGRANQELAQLIGQ